MLILPIDPKKLQKRKGLKKATLIDPKDF